MLPYVDAAQHKPIAAKQQAKQSQGTKQNQQQQKGKSWGVSGSKGAGGGWATHKTKASSDSSSGSTEIGDVYKAFAMRCRNNSKTQARS